MTGTEKSRFRQTKTWKQFRQQLRIDRQYTCEICGIKKKTGLQVHHLDEEHYTDLNPQKFKLLCSSCHQEVERLLRRKVINIQEYCSRFKDVFTSSRDYAC